MDEAAQTIEPAVVQLLNALGTKETRFHQIGDHLQLPAYVDHPGNRASNNNMSMFERMFQYGSVANTILTEQHRMHPAIAAFPSSQYYHGALTTHPSVSQDVPGGFRFPQESE